MSKIQVRRADGEVIKIDESEALNELKKIRDKEKRTNSSSRNSRRRSSTRRPNNRRSSENVSPRIKRSNNNINGQIQSNYLDDTSNIKNKRPRKRGRRKLPKNKIIKRRIRNCILALLIAAIGAVSFGYYEINSIFSNMNTVDFPTSNEELGISDYVTDYYKDKDYIKNYALFGTDSRGKESGRTDSLMICSVNTKTGKISLTSILRDTYIKIAQVDDKDYGYDKINAAHSYGGAQMTVKTLNENFDLNITDYVEVNFSAVADIVDALGGIKLNIKSDEISNLNKFIKENNRLIGGKKSKTIKKAGKQVLDGKQALSYCRIRYAGNGDYQRTARQRIVMNTILKTLKSESLLTQKKAMEAVLPYITTSLKASDMWPILKAYFIGSGSISSNAMTNSDIVQSGTINGGWCLIYNTLEDNVKYLHKIIYGGNYKPSEIVEQRNTEYNQKTMYVTKYAINSKVYSK